MRGIEVDGQRFRLLRTEAGLTQEALCAAADCDVKTVRKAERGGRIDLPVLGRLVGALDVEIADIVKASRPGISVDYQGSVTKWIESIRESDPEAGLKLWQRYQGKLTQLASAMLASSPDSLSHGPDGIARDVFTTVFQSICRGEDRNFNREGLWGLMIVTAEQRVKGNSNVTRIESNAQAMNEAAETLELPDCLETAEQLVSVVRELLAHIPSELADITRYRMEGHSKKEIAKLVGKSIPTVARRLQLIELEFKKALGLDG